MLNTLLRTHWGIHADCVQALPCGHTNKTYFVAHGSRCAVLRLSWPGKSVEHVEKEAAVLRHLGAATGLPATPQAIASLDGQPYVAGHAGRWLHLFEHIAGVPGHAEMDSLAVADAMRALALLHRALARLPCTETSPVAWLRQRLERITARPGPALPKRLCARYPVVLQRIASLLRQAENWVPDSARWLHGDYHPGNLIWHGRILRGIVDFDETGSGSQLLEAVFALFALARNAAIEERLAYDPDLWRAGLDAYMDDEGRAEWLWQHRSALALLFCADQTLIHLEAAQRGLWELRPGIGFLAGWHELSTGGFSGAGTARG